MNLAFRNTGCLNRPQADPAMEKTITVINPTRECWEG